MSDVRAALEGMLRLYNDEYEDIPGLKRAPDPPAVIAARAALATPNATPAAEGLDAAWKAAEAALPEGWALSMDPTDGGDYHFMADKKLPMDEWDDNGVDATGPTPAAALRALAARLAADTATEGESK